MNKAAAATLAREDQLELLLAATEEQRLAAETRAAELHLQLLRAQQANAGTMHRALQQRVRTEYAIPEGGDANYVTGEITRPVAQAAPPPTALRSLPPEAPAAVTE